MQEMQEEMKWKRKVRRAEQSCGWRTEERRTVAGGIGAIWDLERLMDQLVEFESCKLSPGQETGTGWLLRHGCGICPVLMLLGVSTSDKDLAANC